MTLFMEQFQRQEPTVLDHSSSITFKTCPRLYFYTVVLAFKERVEPPFFKFGSAYHKFREVLEIEYAKNELTKEALEAAIAASLESFGTKDPPADSKFGFLSRARLIDSMMYAGKHWVKEKRQGSIVVLNSEQPYSVILSDGKTKRGGRIDQVIEWNKRLYVRDFKTSSKSSEWYDRNVDPNDQFTGYTFGASKLSGRTVDGVVVEVLFNTKTKGPSIKPFIATRSSWQLDMWEKEQIHIQKMIDDCREADIWPMFEKTCPFCFYRSVCKKATERAQASQLAGEFTQRPWDFMNPEGSPVIEEAKK